MTFIFKGREIEIVVVGYKNECRIREGYYTDTGEPLAESDFWDVMNEHGDKIAEAQEGRL